MNHLGGGRFRAFSAGSFPKGKVNPFALEILSLMKIPAGGARSKGWDQFADTRSVLLDFVVTVCDKAAGEVCPVWPGEPVKLHWSIDDPATVQGDDERKLQAFRGAFRTLEHLIRNFVDTH